MKPFIPYARTSSDEQKDAETIKTQIAEVERYALAHGLPLVEWVMDDGISGVIPFHERRGGARVLELLRSKQYAGVACLNHKRIGRDAYVIHLAVRQIEQELRLDIQAVREPVLSQFAPGARALSAQCTRASHSMTARKTWPRCARGRCAPRERVA